jgi:glycosyltransferase involved in cell wall biosynthesis
MKQPRRAERPVSKAAGATTGPLRVLIAAHSHPEVSNGGAEISAFQLFQALRDRPDCQSWFLGCDRSKAASRPGALLTQPWSDAEFLYSTQVFDWFKFANPDVGFSAEIESLFRELSPDVVHFHHYINFGVEIFQHLKRARPDCRIVLTLHEYLAICHHYGQMVTTKHHTLCPRASPDRCNRCFPEYPPTDFFLRKRYIMRFFDLVDTFVAPSQFLADRYVDWGVPVARMVVLDNLMPAAPVNPPALRIDTNEVLRIGFFGQISMLKGINVLLDAAETLAADGVRTICFEIFGDYLAQAPELRDDFLTRLGKAGSNVRFNGPYERNQVDQLMQTVHAVLMPSIWWENSPLVIQEARRNRRPIICSGIGGMAEKVREGVDGFHFPAGNALALAALLKALALAPGTLEEMSARMNGRKPAQSRVDDFVAIYRGKRGKR